MEESRGGRSNYEAGWIINLYYNCMTGGFGDCAGLRDELS